MHLDARSWYSFHDGTAAPAQLAAAAAELGFKSLGLCDMDGVYGQIDFYRACLKEGLRPLLGLALSDPRPAPARLGGPRGAAISAADNGRAAAILLARNREGYRSLCALASWRQKAHPDPQLQKLPLRDAILRLGGNCFVITDRRDLLELLAPRLGPRRVFVRCDPDFGDSYKETQRRQAKLSAEFSLQRAACTDSRFIRPQDQPLHHLLRAIGQNVGVQLASGVRSARHYLLSPFELPGLYESCPGALKVALQIAEQCEADFSLEQWDFPDYEQPDGRVLSKAQAARALHELSIHYSKRRCAARWDSSYEQRLERELDVIYRLGYTSYFLACWDIVGESRRRGMPVLGRGSAGNSLVSYLLGITPVDPVELNLPFERFINPERVSPPDIDLDFDWRRRDEIIDYVFDRWGKWRTARISTHVTMRGRGAFRATAKACGIGADEISRLSRRLPWINPSGLRQLDKYPELKNIDLSDNWAKEALQLASRLSWVSPGGKEQGLPTHLGVHAGGVVIAPGDILRYTALSQSPCGHPVTHFEMHGTEACGLIKIDLLGNRSLGVALDTVTALHERGIAAPISDYRSIERDPQVRRMLRTGRTMGCFYVESPAMRQLLKRLGTQDFLELTAASSVIRPGVAESGMMQEYIRRSRGLPEEQPSHPKMRELMAETHGVMIYQEDVIHAAHAFAGFTRAQADVLRRGMSGKLRSREQLNELRESFVRGCIDNGLATRDALEIWRQVESFSGYAFCKAHSASFATLSMQVAWLKAHHPAEFMAAVLSNGGGFYGPQTYISECWRLGLAVLPPDVNKSALDYRAEYGGKEQGLRVGLSVIKRLPLLLKERIIAAREAGGPYTSLQDFIRRAKPGPGWLAVLIDCGALDCLGLSRAELLRLAGDEYGRAITDGQQGERRLFRDDESAAAAQQQVGLAEQLDPRELMRRDLEHFGFYCRFHPLVWVEERYPQLVRARDMARYCGQQVTMLGWHVAGKRVSVKDKKGSRDWLALVGEELDQPEEYFEEEDEEKQSAAEDLGILNSLGTSVYRNRTGRSMLMLSLEDLSDTFESVLFPDAWERLATVIYDGGPWLLRGTVDEMLGACTLNVSAMKHVEL